jgi:hypothetical protein
MDKRIMTPERWVLLGMFALLATLVALTTFLAPALENSEPLPNRSVYNSAPSGYRAWFLASQRSGITIVPWEKSFEKLNELPAEATMVLVEPLTYSQSATLFGRQETEQLLEWVAQGNSVVLLDHFRRNGSQAVLLAAYRSLALRPPAPEPDQPPEAVAPPNLSEDPQSQNPSPQTLQSKRKELDVYVDQPVLSESRLSLWPKRFTQEAQKAGMQVLLEDTQGNPRIVEVHYGKGRLILGTVADLGGNHFLQSPPNDNAQYLANLLRREGKLVFINEYVHGYAESGNLSAYLSKNTPLGEIFVQLTLVFILVLWLSLRPWTPKPQQALVSAFEDQADDTEQPNVFRSSMQAYLDSMAGIYQRTHAASLALGPQVNRLEKLLNQRFGILPEEEARLKQLLETFPGDYSSKGSSPESLMTAWVQSRAIVADQGRLPDRELLHLARQLTLIEEQLNYERHWEQRWEHGREQQPILTR